MTSSLSCDYLLIFVDLKDKVLIQLHSDGQESSVDEDPVIVVHPDYVLDD